MIETTLSTTLAANNSGTPPHHIFPASFKFAAGSHWLACTSTRTPYTLHTAWANPDWDVKLASVCGRAHPPVSDTVLIVRQTSPHAKHLRKVTFALHASVAATDASLVVLNASPVEFDSVHEVAFLRVQPAEADALVRLGHSSASLVFHQVTLHLSVSIGGVRNNFRYWDLPTELQMHILHCMDARTVQTLGQVSKPLRAFVARGADPLRLVEDRIKIDEVHSRVRALCRKYFGDRLPDLRNLLDRLGAVLMGGEVMRVFQPPSAHTLDTLEILTPESDWAPLYAFLEAAKFKVPKQDDVELSEIFILGSQETVKFFNAANLCVSVTPSFGGTPAASILQDPCTATMAWITGTHIYCAFPSLTANFDGAYIIPVLDGYTPADSYDMFHKFEDWGVRPTVGLDPTLPQHARVFHRLEYESWCAMY